MPYVIEYDGARYAWKPSRSTPSVPHPVAELDVVVNWLRARRVRSVVDFGCGNGRNVPALAAAFSTVVLVEVPGNTVKVQARVAAIGAKGTSVMSNIEYAASNLRVNAALLACVVHTLPDDHVRRSVVKEAAANLSGSRWIAFITPTGDSAYGPTRLGDAVHFGDGIVRLHQASKTFSFYRQYARAEFERFIVSLGLRVEEHVAGDHRHAFLARPA